MKNSSRRHFLKKLAWGIPAGYVLPQYLFSCKDEQFFGDDAYTGRVAIIGAGVAGLHAANILNRHGAQVRIFEASDRWGGRIRSEVNTELVNGVPIELGADRIYGRNNLFYESLRTYTSNIGNLGSNLEYTYFREDQRVGASVTDNRFYKKYAELESSLGSYTGEDLTLQGFINLRREEEETQALRDPVVRDDPAERINTIGEIRNIYIQVVFIWSNIIGDQLGVTLDQLTTSEYLYIKRERAQLTAERYQLHHSTLQQILATKYASVLPLVEINNPVSAIDHSGARIKLSLAQPSREEDNSEDEFDRVLITVPIKVLARSASGVESKGHIVFTPELKEQKREAIQNIRMSPCAKIFLKFRERFWRHQVGAIYTSTQFKVLIPHPGIDNHILVGYAFGHQDVIAAEMADSNAGRNLVQALDPLFPNPNTSQGPLPSFHLLSAKLVTWTENSEAPPNVNEYIPGAFSYTVPGAQAARDILAAPYNNRIFFAGEATHTRGEANTVHGAMETGYRAAYEIITNADVVQEVETQEGTEEETEEGTEENATQTKR